MKKILHSSGAAIILITLLGGGLRFSGLDWGLPWRYHVDENAFINAANAMRKAPHGDYLNPKWFYHPSLSIYAVCALSAVSSLFSPLTLARVHLLGRLYSAFWGTVSIPLLFLLGRKLYRPAAGLLAALFLAAAPIHVQQSHFFTPDTALGFFLILIMYFSIVALRRGRAADYALAGAAAGAAMAAKYWAPAFLPVLVAFLYGARERGRSEAKRLGLAALLAAAAFFILSPYVILDAPFALPKIVWWAKKTAGSIPQVWAYYFEGAPPYLSHLTRSLPWGLGWPLAILSAAGFIHSLLRRRREDILLASWIALNFLLIGSWYIKFMRYLLPIIPFLCLAAGELLARLLSRPRLRPLGIFAAFAAFLPAAVFSLALLRVYAVPHTKTRASEWVYANIPAGATIATDHSIPLGERNALPRIHREEYLDFAYLFDHPLSPEERARYLEEKTSRADYIVLSEETREYFSPAAKSYPVEWKFLDDLFSGRGDFDLVQTFRTYPGLGRWEIRDDGAELSWRFFDHPVIYVFRKSEVISDQ
jgi:4-amino-4-deoxy-L-arabinose transferase-like glycosyltransferase